MTCARGKVVALDGATAVVETLRPAACVGCAQRDACSDPMGAARAGALVRVANEHDAGLGDEVEIDVAPRGVVLGAALVYLVPAAAAVAGAFAGAALGPRMGLGPDPAAVVGLFAGVLVALGGLRLGHPWLGRQKTFRVSMVRVVGALSGGGHEAPADPRPSLSNAVALGGRGSDPEEQDLG